VPPGWGRALLIASGLPQVAPHPGSDQTAGEPVDRDWPVRDNVDRGTETRRPVAQ
jgi:hypothetical protein